MALVIKARTVTLMQYQSFKVLFQNYVIDGTALKANAAACKLGDNEQVLPNLFPLL